MADVKNVSLTKPVKVRVESGGEIYFVTVYKNGTLKIRPKGARNPDAVALVSIDSTYKRALLVRAREDRPKRKRQVSRGLVTTERRRGV